MTIGRESISKVINVSFEKSECMRRRSNLEALAVIGLLVNDNMKLAMLLKVNHGNLISPDTHR